eukprot:gene23544-biopygen1270
MPLYASHHPRGVAAGVRFSRIPPWQAYVARFSRVRAAIRTAPGARKVGPDDTDELRELSIASLTEGTPLNGDKGEGGFPPPFPSRPLPPPPHTPPPFPTLTHRTNEAAPQRS